MPPPPSFFFERAAEREEKARRGDFGRAERAAALIYRVMNTTRLVFFALRGFHLKMGAREQKESFKLRVKALKAVVGEIENLKVLSAASDAEASVLEHLHTFLDEASKVCDGVIEVMGGWSDPAAPLPSLNERQAISFRVALASVFLACAHGLALAEPVSGAGSAPEEEKEEDGGEEEEEGEGKEGEGEQGGGQGEQGKRVREEEEGARSRAGGVGGVVGGASSSSSSSSTLPAALAALASLAPLPNRALSLACFRSSGRASCCH